MPKPGYVLYLTEEEASWLTHHLGASILDTSSASDVRFGGAIKARLDEDAPSTNATQERMTTSIHNGFALGYLVDQPHDSPEAREMAGRIAAAALSTLTDEGERQ